MKSRYIPLIFIVTLLIEILLYLQNIISIPNLVLTLTMISFILVLVYMYNEINEKNPKRFYKNHYNMETKLSSMRFDFSLLIDFLKNAFYFASMSFVLSSIIIYLLINIWSFEIKIIMQFFGFNVLIIFIKVMEDIYNSTQDKCEERIEKD